MSETASTTKRTRIATIGAKANRWRTKKAPLFWLLVAAIAALLLSLGFALLLPAKNLFEVPLAIIGGGLLSTWVILYAEDRRRDNDQVRDLQYGLASELNLNVGWARYNSGPLSDPAARLAWVPFKLDACFAVLQQRTAFDWSAEVWDTIEQAVDRMHSFNADRETAYQLVNVCHSELPARLRNAMLRHHASCTDLLPSSGQGSALYRRSDRNYGDGLTDERVLRLREYRSEKQSTDTTQYLEAAIQEVWGESIS